MSNKAAHVDGSDNKIVFSKTDKSLLKRCKSSGIEGITISNCFTLNGGRQIFDYFSADWFVLRAKAYLR